MSCVLEYVIFPITISLDFVTLPNSHLFQYLLASTIKYCTHFCVNQANTFRTQSRDPPFHLCSLRRLIPAELADWSVWGIQSTETGLLPAAKIDCTGTYWGWLPRLCAVPLQLLLPPAAARPPLAT